MQILYKNKKVEKICENITSAKKFLGDKPAKDLLRMTNFIKWAPSFLDVMTYQRYYCHKLSNQDFLTFSLAPSGKAKGLRVKVIPRSESGNGFKNNVDIEMVKSVEIVLVEEVSNHYEKAY